ncbi:Glycosyltransferase family 92 [Popillia japonica]|uniref:Glycosyltransferase family 92 protein n=1 Tax=Popillia japonica TaxID=7064 RepID=A0AAW1LRF7_POPJA
MGSASGGKRRYQSFRNKQRANMSFFIVVIFFAVFGIIVFTEIFLIDERGRGAGVLVRHGSIPYHHRTQDKPDYEDALQDNGQDHNINEAQLPPFPANFTPVDGAWQIVNGTRYKFYVFSAFLDARKGQRAIRIIGATKTRGADRVWCRFWYKTSEANSTSYASKTVPAKLKVIRENWNLKYSACFILCGLGNDQIVPTAVSVVAKVKQAPSNILSVINNYNETKPASKMGVCVKALHFDYNKALQLLEFIELHRILGVDHFTFYNHTVGAQVACLLEHYINKGLVTLLPWQLNMVSQKEIRTEGLFAALNDCLYRSMYKYSHVILIDLDEFIIPKHNDTLPQLLSWLSTKVNTEATGSFSFQNAFFYLQWGDDDWVYTSDDPIATSLLTLKKTRRKTKLHPHKQRSKYICRPEFVVETGNHFIWEFIPGHNTFNVPADAAILHHYRICEFGGDDCIQTASTVDVTTFKYRDRLVEAVGSLYEQYRKVCSLPDLPPPPRRENYKLLNFFSNR